jgi:hypothetical protein
MGVSSQFHHFTTPPPPSTRWIGGWVGPRLGLMEKSKIMCLPDTNPGPACSLLLYPLSYLLVCIKMLRLKYTNYNFICCFFGCETWSPMLREEHIVGFEVLTAVVIKSSSLWGKMSCSLMIANRRFRETHHLHF